MKKLFILAAALIGIAAQAEVVGPAWTCRLDGDLTGQSIGLGLSVANLEGVGAVSCYSIDGNTQMMDVAMKIQGVGLGLGYSDYTGIHIASADIGVVRPDALVGSYSVGPTAGVTLIGAGIEFGAALKLSRAGGASFELGLVGAHAHGIEAKIQLQTFEIEPAAKY